MTPVKELRKAEKEINSIKIESVVIQKEKAENDEAKKSSDGSS